MKSTDQWERLSKEAIEKHVSGKHYSTYNGEVILVNKDKPYIKNLYFNAQDFFSDDYLNSLPVYDGPEIGYQSSINGD